MLRKWTERLFCLVFAAMLVLPLVTMNFQKEQISEIDNAYLPELEFSPTRQFLREVEDYVNARMGFRTEILDLYQKLNDKVFGLMEHPLYMYGKDGHVFFRMDTYVKDFQRMNLDPEWTAHFADNIQNLERIAEERGIGFIYMLLPDKKTVYAEYFPDTILQMDNESRTDQVLRALDARGVNTFYPKDLLLAAKETMPVANKKYDAGHWNENGAFVTYRALMDGPMREFYPEIEPIEAEDFRVVDLHQYTLAVSRFIIDEWVPHYEPNNTHGAAGDDNLIKEALPFLAKAHYARRYIMEENAGKPKLLVMHDSYMIEHEKFFTENFSEITFIHRENIRPGEQYEQCLDVFDPDIVIYENPERTFPIRFKDGSEEQND